VVAKRSDRNRAKPRYAISVARARHRPSGYFYPEPNSLRLRASNKPQRLERIIRRRWAGRDHQSQEAIGGDPHGRARVCVDDAGVTVPHPVTRAASLLHDGENADLTDPSTDTRAVGSAEL
jgi:hypothetical protein